MRRERSFVLDGTVFEQSPQPGQRLRRGTIVRLTVSVFEARRPPPPPPAPPASKLPGVVGLDYWEAAARMEALGIIANSYPVRSSRQPTYVVGQSPPEGTRATRGARVKLTVSVGRGQGALGRVVVPKIVGLSEIEAHSRCRDAHLTCRTVPVPGSAGIVVRQHPEPGERAERLTQMKLLVGR